MGVEIDGFEQTRTYLERLAAQVQDRKKLGEVLQDGGKPIFDEMKRNADNGVIKVDTGALSDALTMTKPRYGRTNGGSIDIGIPRDVFVKAVTKYGKRLTYKKAAYKLTKKQRRDDMAYYPAFVEYGHGGPHPARPHPFVRPAYDVKEGEAIRIMQDELRMIIDSQKKR